MEKYITWDELSKEQLAALDWFSENPPKYYKWFYKFYQKYIGKAIFFGIITVGILMLIFNDAIFDVAKGFFFALFGLVLWSASAFVYKHFYTKKYANKMGLTLKNFNYLTKGMVWDI
jgi:hypothetical protein